MKRFIMLATLFAAGTLAACADDLTSPATLARDARHNLSAQAANILVTTDDDASKGETTCTLREAILAATINAEVSACAAGNAAQPDVIGFDGSLDGETITLALGRLEISSDMVIDGGGKRVTISGDGVSQVFHIGAGTEVVLRGLTITGGNDASTKVGDDGGGIHVETVDPNDSTRLTLEESTVTGNHSVRSGAGINAGFRTVLTLRRSTISGNTAVRAGGGIHSLSRVVIDNTTITANTADVAGGINNNPTVGFGTITNSIIAGNTATNEFDPRPDCAGTFASSGYNVFGVNAECPIGSEDIGIAADAVFSVVLDENLADHGGSTTTHALLDPGVAGSANPAVDIGGTCGPTDQRGLAAPAGAACDAGAVEFTPSNSAPTANAGEDQTVECEADGCAVVTLDGSGSSDPDGDGLTYLWTNADGDELSMDAKPTLNLEVGTHTIRLVVDDGTAVSAPDEVIVTVEDKAAPVLTVGAESGLLWAPNHKYQTIRLKDLGLTASDACDAALSGKDAVITKVTSDEPDDVDGDADGITSDDIVITDCRTVKVRAQRDETGNGRVYTLHLAVQDVSGNVGTATYTVGVPVVKNGTAVDDGEAQGYAVTQAASCSAAT